MKKKVKVVRRGDRWCVRIKADRDEFDRKNWPVSSVQLWLTEYGIPHYSKKKKEYVEYDDIWGNYTVEPIWDYDYFFERKEDATWFLLEWGK